LTERRAGRRPGETRRLPVLLAISGLLILAGLPAGARAAYPVLPDSEWSAFLVGLSAPTLTPGGSGSVSFQLGDPLPSDLTSVRLILQFYAFNPTDGGAPQPVPPSGAPVFTGGSLTTNVTLGVLSTGTHFSASLPVTVPTGAPLGDYALRFQLSFTTANASYLLESRGHFSAAAWAAATVYSNGTSTINASQLGVSGVIPETSVLVSTASIPLALYGVLGVGIALAALGGYWWTRSETKSSAGARRSSPPQSAPTAFGSKRKSDGD
jgi:hypothetical protein